MVLTDRPTAHHRHRIDYGIFVNAFHPIATTNLVGFLSGSYFLFVFHQYAPCKSFVSINRCSYTGRFMLM